MANLYGTNVWEGNGNIDWARVKRSSNGDFTLIRAGYDSTNGTDAGFVDQEFANYSAGATNAGLLVGYWWFCYAYTEQMAEDAAHFAANAIRNNGVPNTYPVYYDVEDATFDRWRQHGVTPTVLLVHRVIKKWCDTMEAEGFNCGLYFNANTYTTWNLDVLLAANPTWSRWIAQWSSVPPSWETWDFWQYMGGNYGHVMIDGIPTEVDVDMMYDGYTPPSPPSWTRKMPVWMYLKFPF